MRPALRTVARSRIGAVAPAAAYHVYQRGTTTEVDCYAAATGGSVLTQPLAADSDGTILTYPTASGQYDIETTIDGESVTQPVEALAAGADAWTTASYNSPWTTFSGYQSARYLKDSAGVVHLGGAVGGGSTGNPIFQLPSAYRPATGARVFIVSSLFGTAARVEIGTGGNVTPINGSTVWFLNGIRFMP